MSMVSGVIGGVDTHADVHVAAALDENGRWLGIESFRVNGAGYRRLVEWLTSLWSGDPCWCGGDGVVWRWPGSTPPRRWC